MRLLSLRRLDNLIRENVLKHVDVCPNILGDQPVVPEGMHLNDGQCVPDENQCVDTSVNLYSDTDDQVDNHTAFGQLSFIHPAWTAAIAGAKWIWNVDGIEDPITETTKVFTKDFTVDSVYFEYYKVLPEFDIEGYRKIDGNLSTNIPIPLSDQYIEDIISWAALEFMRDYQNQVGVAIGKEKVINN